MSLPNSQVASCVVSLQLDYKLLKVCVSPRFSPIMSTQIWAGVQERVAEEGLNEYIFQSFLARKVGGTVVCSLQVPSVLKALVSLTARPDIATETQGSASHQMWLQFSHFYMPCYTHHF